MAYTELYLHKGVPLDSRYEHTLSWPSQADQLSYLNSSDRFYRGFDDFTYLRKNSTVKVPIYIETLENNDVNYVSMRNSEGQWRFFFIVDKAYLADEVTELHLELDVLQTYQFEWEIPACFVEREHVSDDTPGLNLVDEGLELGEFVNIGTLDTINIDALAIVVQSSVTMNNPMGEAVQGAMINGVYHGLRMYCRTANALGATVVNAALSSLATQGKADGVASIFMYPKALINAEWDKEGDEVMLDVIGMTQMGASVEVPTTLDGYTPRNRKLLTHPYSYLYAHNNAGENAVYHYEHFLMGPEFAIAGSCSQDGVVRMIPLTHRGLSHDNEAGLSLTGYPCCSWSQDAYKIWLAQNMNQQALAIHGGEWTQGMGVATGALSTVGALVSRDVGGALNSAAGAINTYHSGYMQIQSVMAARSDKALQPPQARGTQSPSTNIGTKTQHFTLCNMSIRADYAKRIDQFFDMYGYKVNTVKVPNLKGRAVWNYVKTVGSVVLGGFDAMERRKVAAILDKGVTFWHAPESMYHYELADANVVR